MTESKPSSVKRRWAFSKASISGAEDSPCRILRARAPLPSGPTHACIANGTLVPLTKSTEAGRIVSKTSLNAREQYPKRRKIAKLHQACA